MSNHRRDYEQRINRVLDCIHAQLDAPPDLEELARIACFSRFHFHRIFSAMVGEPVYGYIRRLRLERAASALAVHADRPVLDVALDAGFRSQAAFSRAFREQFGASPSQWRRDRKIGKTERKDWQGLRIARQIPAQRDGYIQHGSPNEGAQPNLEEPMDIRIETLPPREVAYARRIGPYGEAARQAWDLLCSWAGPRDLLSEDGVFLSVSHDDPGVTEQARLRYDACLVVPEQVQAQGSIGRRRIPGGKYAIARYQGPVDQIGRAWAALFRQWLPDSGYRPGDHPGYELYVQAPSQEPPHETVADCCLPIVAL